MIHQLRICGPFLMAMTAVASLFACAPVRLNSIPSPPQTGKLRVYVQPITGVNQGRGWNIPHEEFVSRQVSVVERILERKGIYEVVSGNEVSSVLGEQKLSLWQLERDRWNLARQIGRALYADYTLVMERSVMRLSPVKVESYFDIILINVGTGKVFRVRNEFETDRYDPARWKEMIRHSYRQLFSKAKHDMLEMAMKKGRVTISLQTQVPSGTTDRRSEQAPVPAGKDQPSVEKTMPSAGPVDTGVIGAPTKGAGAPRLVVYDFDATDQYRTAALILVEALREELFKLKKVTLVNREDLQKVLEEMALQQTGLVDESQAVKTGKGLAADQVVTGRFGMLGRTFVLQAKRVDVETFGTLSLATTRFTEGQEDEVLNKMPDFAKTLLGVQ